jgi:hypothetical protein
VVTYRFAGLILSSDVPIPELPRAKGTPYVHVSIGARLRSDVPRKWCHSWRVRGGPFWMRVAATGSGHIVQFPGFAEFVVTPSDIVCHPHKGVPLGTVRHLLLDQLIPALLGSRARLVLHASAVDIGARAIGFLGEAGAGKSTLAAALVRGGASLLTDDALVIDCAANVPHAVPSYPGLRLWPDSARLVGGWRVRRTPVAHYTRKQRWSGAAVPYSNRPLPIEALYVVARGRIRGGIHLMSARQSIMALVRYSMMLDANDRSTVRFGFELASRLVEQIPVRRLVIPAGARALRDTCRALNLVTASARP